MILVTKLKHDLIYSPLSVALPLCLFLSIYFSPFLYPMHISHPNQ